MSNDPRQMVEDPHAHEAIRTSRSLVDSANAGQSVQGYASVNGLSGDSEVARLAYEIYRDREQRGEAGDADGDWFRAEAEVRSRRGENR